MNDVDRVVKNQFLFKMEKKDWTKKELAERWGVQERQITNIINTPKVKDYDALRGLPDYSFNLNKYEELIKFCHWGKWTMKNFETAFFKYLVISLEADKEDSKTWVFDASLAFHLLDIICFEIINTHYRSMEMFESYKQKIESSVFSHDDRLLALVHFINENFYDAFPDYFYDLIAKKQKQSVNDKYRNILDNK